MKAGENKAWELVQALEPAGVCQRAPATWDAGRKCYTLAVFGQPLEIELGPRQFHAADEWGGRLLTRLGYFSHLSILHYLVGAQAIDPIGRWVKPGDLGAGQIYYEGSHKLDLPGLTHRYGHDRAAFTARATALGGVPRALGDVAFELRPLPRVPVILVLWLADEEFEARADLLLDATCEQHLPADLIWAVAMMTLLMFF